MPSSLPLIPQRLPADLRRRLDLAEAAAREALLDAHAEQALDLVAVLAPRMPFDQAVEHYVESMGLGEEEGDTVSTRALSMLNSPGLKADLARDRPRGSFNWRYITPAGAIRYIRRQMKRSAEEELWTELAAARSEEALAGLHAEHALEFVELLADHSAPPQSIALYLDRLDVPSGRSRAAYQRTMAILAETLLPRVEPEGVATETNGDPVSPRRKPRPKRRG